MRLLLAFILVSIGELYLLVKAGSYIGAFNTVAIVILTGVAGAYLARVEGVQALGRIQQSLQQGRMPSGELIDALLIFIAGMALLMPGFMTDLVGIMLLLPPGRALVRRKLTERIKDWVGKNRIHIHYDA